jgi:putative component of toxin-antitoxin plasmid stabilization module
MKSSQNFTIEYFVTEDGREYYDDWLNSLDAQTRGLIIDRIDRLRRGLGFRKHLGEKL